jgi:hypothetical protein
MIAVVFALFAVTAGAASPPITGNVTLGTAFGTGHLFDLGECAAVATQIAGKCFRGMPARIASHLSEDLAANVTCETHVSMTPCWSHAMKYTVHTTGYDCDALAILYADAAELCLREHADGLFWAGIGYLIALVVGGVILSTIVALLKSMIVG